MFCFGMVGVCCGPFVYRPNTWMNRVSVPSSFELGSQENFFLSFLSSFFFKPREAPRPIGSQKSSSVHALCTSFTELVYEFSMELMQFQDVSSQVQLLWCIVARDIACVTVTCCGVEAVFTCARGSSGGVPSRNCVFASGTTQDLFFE